jgi:hypothetical protein
MREGVEDNSTTTVGRRSDRLVKTPENGKDAGTHFKEEKQCLSLSTTT